MRATIIVKGDREQALAAVTRHITTPVAITLAEPIGYVETTVSVETVGDEWDQSEATLVDEIAQWNSLPADIIKGFGFPVGTPLLTRIHVNEPRPLTDHERMLDKAFLDRLDRDDDRELDGRLWADDALLPDGREVAAAAGPFDYSDLGDEDYDGYDYDGYDYDDYDDPFLDDRAVARAESDFLLAQVEDLIDDHVRDLTMTFDAMVADLAEDLTDLIDSVGAPR